MMKKIVLLLSLVTCFNPSKAQVVKMVRLIWPSDSANSQFYWGMNFSGEWSNWHYRHQDEIPKEQNYDVYYDHDYKHLGYSHRGKMNDTGWATVSEKEYYVNGALAIERLYKANGEIDYQISYDYWGDTSYIEKRQGYLRVYERVYARSKWNPEVRYLSAIRSHNLSSGVFSNLLLDESGDTTYCQYRDTSGTIRTLYFQDHRLISSSSSDSINGWRSERIEYRRPDLVYELNIEKKNQAQIDSIGYYVNLKRLRVKIYPWDTIGMSNVLAKLKIISSLKHLEQIQLIGPFETIPSVVFQCKSLLYLDVHDTRVKEIPQAIQSLTLLRSLKLSSNDSLIYGKSIRNLIPLKNLRELQLPLENDQSLPPDIVSLTQLWYLSLGSYGLCSDNYHSPSIDFNLIYQLKQLRTLEICWDQYYKADIFEFVIRMPGCMLFGYETCFDRSSLVTMIDGSHKTIGEVKIGDVLLGYDMQSGTPDSTTVLATYVHHKPMEGGVFIKYHYMVNGDRKEASISTTAIHPFYINNVWTKAGEIKSGDSLVVKFGESESVAIVDAVDVYCSISEEVYNFTTSNHTFFVNGVLVHNK